MDYATLYRKIKIVADRDKDKFQPLSDLTDCLIHWAEEDDSAPYLMVDEVLSIQQEAMRYRAENNRFQDADMVKDLIFRTLVFSAVKNFDHYLQALEYDREPAKKFYLPRRKVLIEHVKALQDLVDDKLDELFMSEPPRTGKTTLVTMFLTWIIGRDPELSNLYSSFSDTLTTSFYNGVLEIVQDSTTYHWGEIFPDCKIAGTNSRDETLNINRKKKYPSLTCRSLYGTLNGACDCNGFLIADDLLSGIEEAMNPDRLATAWNHVDNNLLTRAKAGAKILWIGTRWSIADPIGKRLTLLESEPKFHNRRYKCINIPALDDNDESNFDYRYGVGFDTEYYHQRRASFEANNDMASWFAQYQGEPIEREGTLFDVDGFNYYNGVLPEEAPDRVFMAVDPAYGGGDYTAGPVIYQYGDSFYVADVVFNNGDKSITQPIIARKAYNHHVGTIQVEATKSTMPYVEGVQQELEKLQYHCTVTSRAAPTNMAKEQRIFDRAPDIRSHFLFLDANNRTKEYQMFMSNVFSFKLTGKNKHDDAPDSLSIACDMAFKGALAKPEFLRRPW